MKHLWQVDIPETVTQIEDNAFYGYEDSDRNPMFYVRWDYNTMYNVRIGEGNFNAKRLYCPVGTMDMYRNMIQFQNVEEFEEWDEAFAVFFCGKKVRRSECENITRNVTSGRVSYDRFDKIFKLEDATIEVENEYAFEFDGISECEGIELYGDVTVNVVGESYNSRFIYNNKGIFIHGDEYFKQTRTLPRLTVNTSDCAFRCQNEMTWSLFEFSIISKDYVFYGNGNGSLSMDDCPGVFRTNSNEIVVYGMKDVYWGGTTLVDPAGACFIASKETICYEGTYNPVKGRLQFSMISNDGLTIGGRALSGNNSPYLESGSLNWNVNTQTLTLNNATINVPNGEGVRIGTGVQLKVYGTNTIKSKGNALTIMDGDSKFSGTGSLKIESQEGFGLVYDYFLDFDSGSYDIYGREGAIDGTSRRGFEGTFEVNCPLRLSSYGYHSVLKNVVITDNSSAYLLGDATDPMDCYFIATPKGAYYDESLKTLCDANNGGFIVNREVVYKSGRELGYQRYPLSIGKIPVSNLNCHQILPGVSLTGSNGDILEITKSFGTYDCDAICVESGMKNNLDICVGDNVYISADGGDYSPLRINADVKVTITSNSRNDDGRVNLMAEGTGSGIWLSKGKVEFYCVDAYVSGRPAIYDFTNINSLTLCHANVKFHNTNNLTPVYVKSLSTYKETLTTHGVKFSSNDLCFVSTSTGEAYKGDITFKAKHPTVWIAGQQVMRRKPYLGNGNTGWVYYDFHYDEMEFHYVTIKNDEGSAVIFEIDDLNNMNNDTGMYFYGTNTLIGTTAGIRIQSTYDDDYEEYPIIYMGLYGGNENASDNLIVETSNGPAIYLVGDDGSELNCHNLNINATGRGAFYADRPTVDDPYGMSLTINNCNISAYNTDDYLPTMGYYNSIDLRDCYFENTGYSFNLRNQCVSNAYGNKVTDTVLIRNREDYVDGIEELKDSKDLKDLKDLKDYWYNLAGQRLSKPQKGINIINGKKVLIK